MQIVLTRPSAEEADDYQEYKRLRQLAREQQVKPAKNTPSPGTLRNLDMADGVYEDDTAEAPLQGKSADKLPPESFGAKGRPLASLPPQMGRNARDPAA